MKMKKAISLLRQFKSAVIRYEHEYDRTGNIRELGKAAKTANLSAAQVLRALSGSNPTKDEVRAVLQRFRKP